MGIINDLQHANSGENNEDMSYNFCRVQHCRLDYANLPIIGFRYSRAYLSMCWGEVRGGSREVVYVEHQTWLRLRIKSKEIINVLTIHKL